MSYRWLPVVVIVLLLSVSSDVPLWSAEGPKAVRPCLTSDLVGTWELRNINTKIKIDPKDAFGWPHQRFSFDRRGDVKEMMSITPIEGDKAAVQRFDNAASTSKYAVDERGILSISKIESPEPELCMCSYATKDVPADILAKLPEAKRSQMPHQGDIVLTYMNRNGQPVVIKSLKKV